MSRSVLIVVALLAAGLALAGCGGEETLSKQELIAAGDALCAKADREAEALGEPRTVSDVERLTGVFDTMVSDFGGLEPPSRDRARIVSMLRDFDRGITRVGAVARRAIAGGQEPEMVQAPEGWRLLERAGAAARDYGFDVCGRDE